MANLLATERTLYEQVWQSVSDYGSHAPGEHYLPIFLEMISGNRGRVLDAGCGSGKGGLALRVAGALGRIAGDRVDEAFGRALPRTPEQLADPRVLDELFANHAPPGAPRLPRVRRAHLPGVRFESSNCTNFLIEVEFAGGPDPALPRTLYAKLPARERAMRVRLGLDRRSDVGHDQRTHARHRVLVAGARVELRRYDGGGWIDVLVVHDRGGGVHLFARIAGHGPGAGRGQQRIGGIDHGFVVHLGGVARSAVDSHGQRRHRQRHGHVHG